MGNRAILWSPTEDAEGAVYQSGEANVVRGSVRAGGGAVRKVHVLPFSCTSLRPCAVPFAALQQDRAQCQPHDVPPLDIKSWHGGFPQARCRRTGPGGKAFRGKRHPKVLFILCSEQLLVFLLGCCLQCGPNELVHELELLRLEDKGSIMLPR